MLSLSSIMIGSSDPQALAAFYEKVFERKPDMSDKDWYGFSVGSGFVMIGIHDKVKGKSANPERIIFNLESKEIKAEYERVKKLGAGVIAELYHMGDKDSTGWICTFADPEGNYFQIVSPWE